MLTHLKITILTAMMIVSSIASYAQEKGVFLREDFNTLENWKPLLFEKIKEHTEYSINNEGHESYLIADSSASASGIVFKKEFEVFDYPKIRWRWKVSNVYKKGNAKVKAGDDYPIRVYVIFKYNPETASFGQRVKYGLAKKIYGEYPPHSSVNYIWSNINHEERIIENPYASAAKMIILQTGADMAGKWIGEEVNVIEDYQKAFGEDPPSTASLAIMNDSDNTGESAVSYIDYIEIFR
jgi:hypothetical protein